MNRPGRDWLAGLVVGVAIGFLFWLFPLAAVFLLLAFAAVAAWQHRLVAGLSGAFCGIGGTWLVVLARSVIAGAQFDAAPNQECVRPDLRAWFIAGLAMIVVGTSLALVGQRRSR